MTLFHHHAAASTIGIARVAGQCMLAILAFAVIVWMTEALDYAVSGGDGLLLTVIAFALVMLLGVTYRRWLGYA
jgi:hypothetical protein